MALPSALTFIFLASLTFISGSFAISIEPNSTRAEGRTNPNGISTVSPRLSWRLTSTTRGDYQSAYQVQVASRDCFLCGPPDLWDSGKVLSSNVSALYTGKALKSRQIGWWRVRAYDAYGAASSWSDSTTFELGLLNPADWEAKWITNTQYKTGTNSLPMFAKRFNVACPVRSSRLYIVGVGLHAAQINGKDASTNLLSPGYNSYSKTLTYDTYNITGMLMQGANVVGVELGKGAYDAEASPGRYMKWTTAPMELRFISQLEYTCTNGTKVIVPSDETWNSTLDGPRLESSWFGGEEFDARQTISNWSSPSGDRSTWDIVNTTSSTGGTLTGPHGPGLAVVEQVDAVSVRAVGSSYVFDFGVNFAGKYTFTLSGCPAGRRIVFWPSERLDSSGLADQSTTGTPIFDGYTCSGSEYEATSPKFMYHGMQYLQVDNLPAPPALANMTGQVIRQNNDAVGTVVTSSSLFNSIHKIIDRAIQSNSYSVLTDCPQREKLGWLEESHLVFDAVTHGYDIQAWSKDIIRTIADSQTSSGLIPDIAPEFVVFSGGFRDEPNWGSAGVILPLKIYMNYGEIEILNTYYTVMQQYINYLTSQSAGTHLLNYGLGDWVTFDSCTPVGVTATFGYQQAVEAMITIATALGKTVDAAKYTVLQTDIRSAFHAKYFDTSSNASYSCGSQACNALALDMGAVPSQYQTVVANTLVESLHSNGNHLTVGEVALPSLFRSLEAANRSDVLFEMMSLTTNVSYGYQVVHGATSLWEKWDGVSGGGSLNHLMLGYGDTWITSLSGIEQAAASVAWQTINFIPKVVGNLTSAQSSYRTPNGIVNASWSLDGHSLTYDVVVPVGAKGNVVLNGTTVTEGGVTPSGRPGVISVEKNGSTTTVVIGSGSYKFIASS